MLIKAPSGGFDRDTLQVPALDFATWQSVVVEDIAPVLLPLTAGLYFIWCPINFQFAHGPAEDVESYGYMPWFANTYLTVYIDTDQTLLLTPQVGGETGEAFIVAAKVYA